MQLFRRFRRKVRLFPQRFEVSRLRGVSSLRGFDDRVTAFYCGFSDATDYYARAAAANVVDRISVPALIIHARTILSSEYRQRHERKLLPIPISLTLKP